MRFHTFVAAAITLSWCNADFMLGIRLVTDAAPSFSSAVLFLSLGGALQCDAVIFLLSVDLH